VLNRLQVASAGLAALIAAHQTARAGEPDDPTYFSLASLQSGCRLEADFEDYEMHLQVGVVCGSGSRKPVRGLGDLEGLVVIDDDAKALEFVRLFSAGRRWMLTAIAQYAEVMAGPKAEPSSFVVTNTVFSRCCTPPSVRRVPNADGETSFEVRRTVVDRTYAVYLLTEVVSRNGSWLVTDRRRTGVGGRNLGLWVIHNR
jgi:hypothetical protein